MDSKEENGSTKPAELPRVSHTRIRVPADSEPSSPKEPSSPLPGPTSRGKPGLLMASSTLVVALALLAVAISSTDEGNGRDEQAAERPTAPLPTVLGSQHIMTFIPAVAPTGIGGGSDFRWSEISWRDWGKPTAVGQGVFMYHNREGADTSQWFWEERPVSITVSDIRTRCGRKVYRYISISNGESGSPPTRQVWGGDAPSDCSWSTSTPN